MMMLDDGVSWVTVTIDGSSWIIFWFVMIKNGMHMTNLNPDEHPHVHLKWGG